MVYIIGNERENMNTYMVEYIDQHTCKRCGDYSDELIRNKCEKCADDDDLMNQINLMLNEMLTMVKNISVLA
jgi:hypothetical protein